jgi:SAM-dependent methyltransferase
LPSGGDTATGCFTGADYIIFLSMALFRAGPGPHDLAVAMSGLRRGERLLVIGCGDAGLIAALAGAVGLTGRACAVDESAQRAERAREAALAGGALLEVESAPYQALPYDPESFDVVVISSRDDLVGSMTPERRTSALQDARRVLRRGGRCLVIEAARRAGLGGLLQKAPADRAYVRDGGAGAALKAAGFTPVRTIAERDAQSFVEGLKSSPVEPRG